MTPISEKVHHNLKNHFQQIDSEKITRFALLRAAKSDSTVIDCRGREISVGLGCEFSGSLRELFWRLVAPCIEEIIQETSDILDGAFEKYSDSQRHETLKNVEMQLKEFVNKIYDRMVELDRGMRGKGYPKSVEAYVPTREVKQAHQLIDRKINTLRAFYPGRIEKQNFSSIFITKLSFFGFGIDLSKAWKWFRGIFNLKK